MDFSSLKDQVSNLSLYDIKAGVRKVQNAVMNYTEMEAKVREATNNEPWGASSTLMQEIANGTYSYHLLNEIMPMIYKRFTEKAAEEWRQIYKALQLLEFLIKNGSERVIDDARSHLSLLKMLRQFQYLDINGKDQGLNVRNRAKELTDLLSDVDRIRSERKKARSNRNKFGGVEGGGGLSAGMSGGGSSSRYGGFGSEDAGYGGYTGQVYGDGGGFGGSTGGQDYAGTQSRRDKFEEYDEGDDPAQASSSSSHRAGTLKSTASSAKRKTEETKKLKEPEVDLFDFGDDDIPPMTPPKPANGKQPAVAAPVGDDDDFDDFISATPIPAPTSAISPPQSTTSITSSTQFAAPKPVSASQGNNINDLVGFSSISPAPTQPVISTPSSAFSSPPLMQNTFQPVQAMKPNQSSQPTGYQAATPNYFTSIPAAAPAVSTATNAGSRPGLGSSASFGGNKTTAAKPKSSSDDAFGSLWSSASAGAGIKKAAPAAGPNLASMAKEKASAGIWGAPAATSSTASRPGQAQSQQGGQQPQKTGGAFDDLLG